MLNRFCLWTATLITIASITSAGIAAATTDDPPTLTELAGAWRVDLRPTPDAEPYYQEMIITVEGDSVAGTFYGTPFHDFHYNTDWGVLHFAFITGDGSGAYNTTGRLVDGHIEGTTHSLGRGFLSVWTAERIDAAED